MGGFAFYAGQAIIERGIVQVIVYQPLSAIFGKRFGEYLDVGTLKVVRDDLGTEAGVVVLEVI